MAKFYFDRVLLDRKIEGIAKQEGVPVSEIRVKHDPHPGAPKHVVVLVTDDECDHWPDVDLSESFTYGFRVELAPEGYEGFVVLIREQSLGGVEIEPRVDSFMDVEGQAQFLTLVRQQGLQEMPKRLDDNDRVIARFGPVAK